MDYAMDILIPIVGALLLGQWLVEHQHWPLLTIVLLPVLGLFTGIGLLYKRQLQREQDRELEEMTTTQAPTDAPNKLTDK
jgi:hypothetical protein